MKLNTYKILALVVALCLTLGISAQDYYDSSRPPSALEGNENYVEGDIYYVRTLPSGELAGIMFDIEGNEYPVATFDGTWWMTWNMRSSTYSDRMKINSGMPSATGIDTDAQFSYPSTGGEITPTPYWDKSQGLLYNHKAALNEFLEDKDEENVSHEVRKGICPKGWHVPSDMEYTEFSNLFGDLTVAGGKMKSLTRLAGSDKNITNASSASADMGGFNILLTAYASNGSVFGFGNVAYLWTSSSTNSNTSHAWYRSVVNTTPNLVKGTYDRYFQYSVRCKKPTPGIHSDKEIYHLASGHDDRSIETVKAKINPDFPNTVFAAYKEELNGGVKFDPELVTGVVGANAVEIEYSMTPEPMTITNSANPWESRESKIKFELTTSANKVKIKEIVVNQTNYALRVDGNFENYLEKITDSENYKSLTVTANTTWKATLIGEDIGEILSDADTGGAIDTQGGKSDASLTYSPIVGENNKYKTATITFSDTGNSPKAAKDITVTMQTCFGTEDLSGLTPATHEQTSQAANPWGTDVIRHEAKPGVYEEFASAWFGNAGRWMTTNLSAKAYDERTGGDADWPSGVPTILPDTPSYGTGILEDNRNLLWGYPNVQDAGNPALSDLWEANKHLGMLYNWAAATGLQNTSTGVQTAVAHDDIQGICPKGWHLPSNIEFTVFENWIKNNTTSHSSMPNNLGTPADDIGPGQVPPPSIPIGEAIKDPCQLGKSSSNYIAESGFSLQPAGSASHGTASGYDGVAYLWGSSTYGEGEAFSRFVTINSNRISRYIGLRRVLMSVRCKKDD